MRAPTCRDCGYVMPVAERMSTPSVLRQVMRVLRGRCPSCGSRPALGAPPVQRRYWA